METLSQNLRFAVRQLGRNPGFAIAVILTLGLAIGANTAIFSIVNALMVKSLPYAQPDRLGTIFERVDGAESGDNRNDIDGEQWELLRDDVPSVLAAVSSNGSNGVNLEAGQNAGYVHAGRISAHYLEVVGVRPGLGRNFSEDEDRPGGPKAAILSFDLWRSTFGKDRGIVGRSIELKGEPYTVIGVLPQGAETPLNAEVYTALQPSRKGEGGGTNYEVVTRLRDGATWQQADAELGRAWSGLEARFAARYPGYRIRWYCVPLQKGQSADLRPKAVALMLAAGFILLIACANLAGLTLVRMLRRTPEIATRLALGASAGKIQGQLWVENLLLALAGGLAGVGVGFAALRSLLSLLPPDFLPVSQVTLDWRVLGFTLAVSICTCLLFGMLPALASRKVDLRSWMATRSSAGADRLPMRQALIAGEVALTVVLLAASGLLIRTLVHLESLPAGFNAENVMTAKASLDDARFHDPAAFTRLMEESTAAMARIPGVKTAAVGLTLPYERALNDAVTLHDGPQAGKERGTDVVYVTAGYFDALEIPLLRGRGFTSSDTANSGPVAIVNKAFAREFYGGADPVGHSLNNGVTIVGMVGDVAMAPGLDDSGPITSERIMYIPESQMNPHMLALVHVWFQPSWIVKTAGPVEGLTGQMQRALASVTPGLPFSGFYAVSDLVAQTLVTQRIEVALLGAMAALALLLSATGIFALVSNMVVQRTREIGIRIALGSSVRRAMAQVGAPGIRASAIGLLLGLALCAGVLRVLRTVIYGVGVYDVPTIAGVILTMAVVTLVATTAPTLRIARIDPAKTLRDE